MVRFPGTEHAGKTSNVFVQHTDITAAILEAAGADPPAPIDGKSFLTPALNGGRGARDHVTVAWGSTPTVRTDQRWFNGKVDGTGVLLHDLTTADPFAANVAEDHADEVYALFAMANEDARGGFPDWLIDLARNQADAPGCSDLAARA